jgi:GST-like protein
MHELAVLADGQRAFLGGGFGHFYAYAPEKIRYAIDRYAMEVKRQMDVLDRRLAEVPYVAGDRLHHRRHGHLALVRPAGQGPAVRAGEFLQVHTYTNVVRWAERLYERPAVRRGRMVNRVQGDPASQLHERHDASDFDLRTQDKLGR